MKALLSRVALASVLMGASVMATAAGLESEAAPKGAKVFIVEPKDGATVDQTFTVKFGIEGMPLVEVPYWDNSAKSWIYGVSNDATPVLAGMAAGYLISGAGN